MSTHQRIIRALKQAQQANQNPLCLEVELDDEETLMRRYFLNYRGGDPEFARGLRLTHTGLIIIKCFFKAHDVELPGDYRIKSQHLIYLDRKCKMPWHLHANHLILFENEMALKAKLVGDMDLLIHSFP